jgi:hypothetical protein
MTAMVSHGMLRAPTLAEIQVAPSRPTVAASIVSPFDITVIRQMTAVSGKRMCSIGSLGLYTTSFGRRVTRVSLFATRSNASGFKALSRWLTDCLLLSGFTGAYYCKIPTERGSQRDCRCTG